MTASAAYAFVGLDPAQFADLARLSPEGLAERGIVHQTVRAGEIAPCRISLENAPAGEAVLLLNHTHQPTSSPYGARGPVFVRVTALAREGIGRWTETPPMLRGRMLSVRTYDRKGHIRDGRLVEPDALQDHLAAMFASPDTDEVHLHFPGYGCYAAKAVRI
jgi:hypothetical protein